MPLRGLRKTTPGGIFGAGYYAELIQIANQEN
jgi:hypothetical protein